MRDLEVQLANTAAAHEESRQQFASQQQESEMAYREKIQQLESDYQSAVHYVKGTEKMLKQLKDQLSRYKTDNGRLKIEIEELEGRLEGDGERSASASADWQGERDGLYQRVEALESELKSSGSKLQQSLETMKKELAESKRQRDEAVHSLDLHSRDLDQLHSENFLLEQRANDAEQKVALLLDQVEHSVDNYRRRSRQIPTITTETSGSNGTAALGHSRNESSEGESVYGGNSLDARNSAALDNLASELETLRSHWEATNKNYRLSTNFDFESPAPVGKKPEEASANSGLSESLADWRKRLDTEDQHPGSDKA
jgi:chromosome segregation ATPase